MSLATELVSFVSQQVVSLRPLRNAAALSADPLLTKPTIGIAGCCARAASGHAAATPPTSVMNSRRFTA
jgi:hypothetical protein